MLIQCIENEINTSRKWMLLKDFGRSGKGLFMATFEKLMKVNKVISIVLFLVVLSRQMSG